MKVPSSQNSGVAPAERRELRVRARSVSRGIVFGKIVCLYGRNRQYYRAAIDPAKLDAEIRRLRVALRLARRQLSKIKNLKNGSAPDIFDAQMAMLEDSSFQAKIESEIIENKVNAEWAVNSVTDGYVDRYKSIPDAHLRDRYIDLEDVAERILAALGGGGLGLKLEKDSIIAARDLRPSTLVELSENAPVGLITEHGGWTSHTFILAREVGIPAVTGIKRILHRVENGDSVIVDGFKGEIVLYPTADTVKKYERRAEQMRGRRVQAAAETVTGSPRTVDGREITIRANIDIPSGYKRARSFGARGIGLYRSEFLFKQYNGFPPENEQYEAYRKIAELTGDDGVKIRTFDIGIEQVYGQYNNREKNPALGLRAIRLGLTQPKAFRAQIRALLRASHERNISIVIPMISGIADIIESKRLIERERAALAKKAIPCGKPKIGIMVEVPSAVLLIDELLEEADFLSLGTNDLVQYLLAADRDNELVAGWFQTLHPAVVRAVRTVTDAAERAKKPLVVCGEMAGSAFYLPLLIGLGATDLSMNANSMPTALSIINGISYESSRELADSALKCRTAQDIENTIRRHIAEEWADFFPPDIIK